MNPAQIEVQICMENWADICLLCMEKGNLSAQKAESKPKEVAMLQNNL